MVLIKSPSSYVADAGSQSGTWVEEKAASENIRKNEEARAINQQWRPSLRSFKSQRLDMNSISVPKNEVTKSHITKRAHSKRQQSPLPPPLPHPAHPIGAVSTCYQTLDSCTNSTSSCSGHGSCISASKAGRTCFVCACEASKIETGKGTGTNGKKTIYWAGDKCERQDVSGDFVLLAGSVIGLIVLVVGSVGLLAGVGSIELPSVLTGGALTSSKRE